MRLFAFEQCDAGFHDFLDESNGERLACGEVDGPFGGREGFPFFLEGFGHGGSGEQAAALREGRQPDQRSSIGFERRNLLADGLGGVGRPGWLNCCAHFVQGSAGGLSGLTAIGGVFTRVGQPDGRVVVWYYRFLP